MADGKWQKEVDRRHRRQAAAGRGQALGNEVEGVAGWKEKLETESANRGQKKDLMKNKITKRVIGIMT